MKALAATAVVGLALIAPASSSAVTTIGSLRDNQGAAECDPQKVYLQSTENGDVTYDLPPTPAVITSWSTNTQGTGLGSLKVLANTGTDSYTVLATSPVQSLTAGLNTFPTRIPTTGGQIGYSFPTGAQNSQRCFYDPADGNGLAVGIGLTPTPGAEVGSAFTTGGIEPDRQFQRLNLTATFEADADADGWGDETQDRCPGAAGDNQGCAVVAFVPPPPPPDVTKPALTGGLKFSRSSFAAAKSGAPFAAQKKKKKKSAPVGTKVSFNLTEAASVAFTIERKTTGRKVSGKCKTQTRKNRKKSKCDLWKKVTGSFTVAGKPGANSFTFRGRIGGKALKRGNYRLKGTATDAARNVSVPTQKTFKIVK